MSRALRQEPHQWRAGTDVGTTELPDWEAAAELSRAVSGDHIGATPALEHHVEGGSGVLVRAVGDQQFPEEEVGLGAAKGLARREACLTGSAGEAQS